MFIPKDVVKRMVDMLEGENPGCFDAPDKTFIDLYMKSGLYITEIVKRLFQSEEIEKHNFKQADALPYAKEGTLSELLDKLYGEE